MDATVIEGGRTSNVNVNWNGLPILLVADEKKLDVFQRRCFKDYIEN